MKIKYCITALCIMFCTICNAQDINITQENKTDTLVDIQLGQGFEELSELFDGLNSGFIDMSQGLSNFIQEYSKIFKSPEFQEDFIKIQDDMEKLLDRFLKNSELGKLEEETEEERELRVQ